MINYESLVKSTSAYKIFKGELDGGKLSHAYLVLSSDVKNLKRYLKVFATEIAVKGLSDVDGVRAKRLIDENNHPDVFSYPMEKNAVSVDDVVHLIDESHIKPLEITNKIFILNDAQDMLAPAQNKLLKTLEEPPKGVCIIIGATSEYPLLPTVRSRVRKLEIGAFAEDATFNALKDDCVDEKKLLQAIRCSDGTVGSALSIYDDQTFTSLLEFAEDVILNMKKSTQVLAYSTRFSALKKPVLDLVQVLELKFRDMLVAKEGRPELVKDTESYQKIKDAEGYTTGAILNALEKLAEARNRKKFNAGETMLLEWLLFQILEGKYKWQK